MNTYEYITLEDVDSKRLEDALNEAGKQGFRLSWMKPRDLADSSFIVVMERKVSRNA